MSKKLPPRNQHTFDFWDSDPAIDVEKTPEYLHGIWIEDKAEALLKSRGLLVARPSKVPGSGPMLVRGLHTSIVNTDAEILHSDQTRLVEVYGKTYSPDYNGRLYHGIDEDKWDDFIRLQEEEGDLIVILLHELTPTPLWLIQSLHHLSHDCKRIRLKPKYDGGPRDPLMVWWRDDMKLFAMDTT